MGFFGEFRDFALRGNVIDLAVGIIIGGAFGKITNSVVNDLIMPPVGRLLGNVDFNDLFINLDPEGREFESLAAARAVGAPVVAYGSFITVVIDFTLLAFAVFLLIKVINALHRAADKQKKEEAKA